MNDQVLALADVAVSLGGRPVLRDIDLTVTQGEVVALLGPNGSGKSTLVRTAVGLHPMRTGSVQLFGTPLPSYDAWQRVGYVPQRSSAATGVPATVWEVVASGRLSRRRLLLPLARADRAAIGAAIDAVGLGDRTGQPVSTLSGGQQQRVLMARALALTMRNESFQLAMMNDTEPSARDVAAFENDLKERKVRLLIYNSQVSEKLTERLRDIARRAKIPVVGVTETMPPNVKFQDWLLGELDAIDKALSGPNS